MVRKISGHCCATLIKVCAAPDGWLRPCSQFFKVRTDTPINCAKADCVKPTLARAWAAAAADSVT